MKNSETLISKMKDQNLKPIPKWHFTLKGMTIGFTLLVSVIIGGLAFSIILFSIQQLGFDLISHMSHSKIEFLLGLLPFLWIVLLIVFLVIGMISIKNSKKGYKFSPSKLLIINTAFSILLGTLFFIGGGAQWFENVFAVKIELYESINEKKINMWSMPENGYLSGTIESVNEETLKLVDFKNKSWTIDYQQAHIPPIVLLEEGEVIKLRGKMNSAGYFIANEVRPWGGSKRFEKRRKEKSD
jgi:cytochrome c-type biogenesis protein CcmE